MIPEDSPRKVVICLMWLAIAWLASAPVNAQTAPAGSPVGAPEAAEGARDPQIVIWSDALENRLGGVSHSPAHDEFMVGWTTRQDLWSHDIWARRLRPDGTLLEHFNVAAVAGELLYGPEIEYCPLHDEYLMVYTNSYDGSGDRADVQARRVAWNGGWMSDILMVSPAVAYHLLPSIAYSPAADEYVVTYANYWPGGEVDLYAQRVRAVDGTLLTWSAVATGGGWARTESRVAFHPAAYGGAGGYLIGYLAYVETPSSEFRVRYKMTQTDLSDLYTNPELDISPLSVAYTGPQVASGQTGFLSSWWELTPSGFQVRARRISAGGTALGSPEGFGVSGVYTSYTPYYFALAVTYAYPGLYLVLWEHPTPVGITEVHGIFVSEGADTTLGDEFTLSATGSSLYHPVAICSPMSDCLFAYEWWNSSSYDIAGDIARLVVMFEDGFESGDTSAWSSTVP